MRQGELEVRLGEGTTRRDLRLEPTTWIAEVTLKGPTPGELERVVVFLAPPGSAAYYDAWLLDQAADLGAVARGTRGAGPGEFTFRLPRDGDWELAVFHRDDLEHPIAMTPSRITVGTGQNSITAAAGARKAR